MNKYEKEEIDDTRHALRKLFHAHRGRAHGYRR